LCAFGKKFFKLKQIFSILQQLFQAKAQEATLFTRTGTATLVEPAIVFLIRSVLL